MSSRRPRLRPAAFAVVGVLLVGCDGIKFCGRCERPEPPPKTIKFEVNWAELGEALKNIPIAGDRKTIKVEPVNMTLTLKGLEGTKTVAAVANWEELIAAVLAAGGQQPCPVCPECPKCTAQSESGGIHHSINLSTFEFRFAPPWFNADQRSLFTSYVVFPAEARLEEWLRDPDESCESASPSAAVCPDRGFHQEVTGPFLDALAQCATEDKKVTLRTVGFASSSGVSYSKTVRDALEREYGQHIEEIKDHCDGGPRADNPNVSDMFNLLVANRRARNAAEMLRGLTSNEKFDIEHKPWCSHGAMVEQRHHKDRSKGKYDDARGLMNRRAEVRLVDLAGCLNVHPDNRIGSINGERKMDDQAS